MDIVGSLKEQIKWSKKSFGDSTFRTGRSHKGILSHIQKELKEIDENPIDLYGWIDLIILGLDGAWRAGYTAEDVALALHVKQCINITRMWPKNDGSGRESVEHIRS